MSQPDAKLSLILATALVAGNMIGSGIYLLPASLGAFGSISLLGWLGALAAAIVYAAMFSVAVQLQRAGGKGVIGAIEFALGRDAAFVASALYWLQALLGIVAISLAVTGYIVVLLPVLGAPAGLIATTLVVIWSFIGLNLAGARIVGRFEALSLALGLLPVMLIALVGWFYFDPHLFTGQWNVSGKPDGVVIPQLVVLVLWAFLGLESASVAAGLVENPQRNVPLATIGGVVLAAIIYISASTALLGIVPSADLAASTAPFADAAGLIIGSTVGLLVACCAALKASGTLAGWILLAAESGHASMTIDRPAASSTQGPGWRHFLFAGLLITGVVLATADPSVATQFGRIANAVVILMICFYALAGAALMRVKPVAKVGLGRASRWLGGGALLMSIAIIVMQDWFTIGTTAFVIALVTGSRLVMKRHQKAQMHLL